ncbi:MAG TPA: hypothetical protein VE646_12810 [Actinomycetota bacterium]|nr:hypothetical protein [Actinomycetota bacterium]
MEGIRCARLTREGRARINDCRTALGGTRRKIADTDLEARARVVRDLGTIERALSRPLDRWWL